MSEISAIILAAGYSSRMGEFKPLLDIGGKPAVVVLIRAILEAGVRNIIVVTGHNSDALKRTLQDHLPNASDLAAIRTTHNARYADGMFTSIQAGIRAAYRMENDGILLFPVDVPLVSSHVIEDVIDAWKTSPDSFVVPCYCGKKGHPLLIPARYAREILAHDGTNGLKAITDKYDDRLIRLETAEEAVVMDMDTRENYAELLRYRQQRTDADDGCRREIHAGGRLFLIRHGSTRQHREKIFLGQTDVPLSHRGRQEAEAAGRKLAAMNPHTDRIYTSDLSRATETAEIVAGILKRDPPMDVIPSARLREIHLGDWDGRYIREIKEAFPEEYEKRGADILRYKRGTEAENYCDLSYRVNKALQMIFEDEARRGISDIVVAAHAGTIRVIIAHLKQIPLADALRIDIPRGSINIIDL
ncbi:MAG: histidine phosphatase family protein [Clostridiales Family XIII bacterium]|jgi:broad specificity phosphatase PhoE/CTP:molybdopterin cytidylyltransferase MocA|nr:histidine phosphatase family protein [Clostridiales Family XIII bacterium]